MDTQNIRDYNDTVKVVFLQGLQGSGKSTIGKYCCQLVPNSIYLEQDMYSGDSSLCQKAHIRTILYPQMALKLSLLPGVTSIFTLPSVSRHLPQIVYRRYIFYPKAVRSIVLYGFSGWYYRSFTK
jgi:hypothetical protein